MFTSQSLSSMPPPGLTRLGGRQSVPGYLRAIWSRREFATVVPLGDLRAQNFDTVLGNLWHVLNPLMLVAVYYVMFGLILETDRGVDNFITFLGVGVFVFHYTQRALSSAAGSILGNQGLIRAIRFPRAILPLSSVIGQTLAFLPAIAVMLVVALATGERPTGEWLLILPILAMQALFNVGGALALARVGDSFADIGNVLPHLFRLLFYMSGVLYSVDRFIEHDLLQDLFKLNPMFAFITLFRSAIIDTPVDATLWLSASAWTVFLLVGGFFFFRAREEDYGRG